MKDDCVLEMILQIPACYPLYSVDVACGKRIGISEDRWRRGILHIVQTCAQNGALMDAVMLWKRNVDQEFQGVVPCPICYWILYPKTMAFPNLTCKTCKTTYHKACLYKWFMQSGKSVCTICQQPLWMRSHHNTIAINRRSGSAYCCNIPRRGVYALNMSLRSIHYTLYTFFRSKYIGANDDVDGRWMRGEGRNTSTRKRLAILKKSTAHTNEANLTHVLSSRHICGIH